MATSAVTVTVTDKWNDIHRTHVAGTLAVGAGDYTTGGLTFSLSGLTKSSLPPSRVHIYGTGGWVYSYVPGTTQANGKLKIMGQHPTDTTTGVLPLEELGAAATPASVVADTIYFYAIFHKLR
jgi:hypothetical protein